MRKSLAPCAKRWISWYLTQQQRKKLWTVVQWTNGLLTVWLMTLVWSTVWRCSSQDKHRLMDSSPAQCAKPEAAAAALVLSARGWKWAGWPADGAELQRKETGKLSWKNHHHTLILLFLLLLLLIPWQQLSGHASLLRRWRTLLTHRGVEVTCGRMGTPPRKLDSSLLEEKMHPFNHLFSWRTAAVWSMLLLPSGQYFPQRVSSRCLCAFPRAYQPAPRWQRVV